MLASDELVAFVGARDLDRARAFYAGVLGLAVLDSTPFACVFDAHGTTLRVTAVSEVVRAGYTVLGWRVDDISASVVRLASAGVLFTRYDGMDQDEQGVWTTPGGDRIAWFSDPDGNVLSLTQHA